MSDLETRLNHLESLFRAHMKAHALRESARTGDHGDPDFWFVEVTQPGTDEGAVWYVYQTEAEAQAMIDGTLRECGESGKARPGRYGEVL